MKLTIAAMLMLFAVACGQSEQSPDITLNTVIKKRYFIDEQGKEHWVLDCKVGQTTTEKGGAENIFRRDEVTRAKYDQTRTFNFKTGEIGDKC